MSKTPNNKRKRDSSSSADSDDDMFHDTPSSKHSSPRKLQLKLEESDESDSDEGVLIKGKVQLISPLEAMKHLAKIKEKHDGKDPSMKNAIGSYCSEIDKGDAGKELQTSLTKYLHLAIQPTKLPLNTGSSMMSDFLTGPNALKFIPGFPPKPKNALFCYAALNDIDNGLGMLKEAADRMKKDEKGKAKAEKEAVKEKAAYVENLQQFLDKHGDRLSDSQKKNVEMTLKRFDKMMHPEKYVKEKTPGSAKRKKKEEPKSAFEHFVSLSVNLYADLEPEKRMKKLQKKFDKLGEDVREVYEKLALQG